MGQLFDRFASFLKSELRNDKFEIPNNDDELSKIIEELNRPKQTTNSSSKKNTEEAKFSNSTSKMDLQKAYEILEIPMDANPDAIQNSYRRLVKEYHPDKVNNMGKEIRLIAEQKTIEINQAYEYIRKIKNF